MRYEKNQNQELVDRKPLNFGIEYQFKKISLLMEYTKFDEDTGNVTSSIERVHEDMTFWMRYHFWDLKQSSENFKLSLYGGLGAGAFQEKKLTRL